MTQCKAILILTLLMFLVRPSGMAAQDSVTQLQKEVRAPLSEEKRAPLRERLDKATEKLRQDIWSGSLVELNREIGLGLRWIQLENQELFEETLCAGLDDAAFEMAMAGASEKVYLSSNRRVWRNCLMGASRQETALKILKAGPPWLWHYESAKILILAGEQDILLAEHEDSLIKSVLRLDGLERFAPDPASGRAALESEASRGNVAGVILLRKTGFEDPSSPEALDTADAYWQGIGSDSAFFQTEGFSQKGRETDVHFAMRVPKTFLDHRCSGRNQEKVTCQSEPFELIVAYRQAWMAEVIDQMFPGDGEKEHVIASKEDRSTYQTTLTGRKGGNTYRVIAKGPLVLQAETQRLAENVWSSTKRQPISATAPIIGWILILFVVALIILKLIPKRKTDIDGSYDVS